MPNVIVKPVLTPHDVIPLPEQLLQHVLELTVTSQSLSDLTTLMMLSMRVVRLVVACMLHASMTVVRRDAARFQLTRLRIVVRRLIHVDKN